MPYDLTQDQLISLDDDWRTDRPHVIILGAGAGRAAFPDGDATGRTLPVMKDLVEIVGLTEAIRSAGLDPTDNFESLYSRLNDAAPDSPLLRELERRIFDYFEGMSLPNQPILYDLLLLSLREKDAIFTFNWDPFLVDAFERCRVVQPPQIFHLHGNVRIAFCESCGKSMTKRDQCPLCLGPLVPSKLLYPVESKNYDKDKSIATQWDAARHYIDRALLVTFFGYSAPTTDAEAKEIIKSAWKPDDEGRLIQRIEIIDVCDWNTLGERWHSLAHFGDRISYRSDFFGSSLALSPRRTCEALWHTGFHGRWVERIQWAGNSPSAFDRDFDEIYDSLQSLMAAEHHSET